MTDMTVMAMGCLTISSDDTEITPVLTLLTMVDYHEFQYVCFLQLRWFVMPPCYMHWTPHDNSDDLTTNYIIYIINITYRAVPILKLLKDDWLYWLAYHSNMFFTVDTVVPLEYL